MEKRPSIAIMTHDLNPWGGQDRSMLEIAWQLNQEFPIQIHSFSLEGYENWPNMQHIQYDTAIKRPILLKDLKYHLSSWKKLRSNPNPLVQSTGTASLTSDVVQVQFVHHSWQQICNRLPPDKVRSSSLLRNSYQSFLNFYKKELERRVYSPQKRYIAISHSIKKELMENFNIPQENIEIIYHGVNSKYFHPWQENEKAAATRQKVRKQLGVNEGDFVFLHVGNLHARKGLFKSLEVLSFLKKHDFHNVKLLAVGQGEPTQLKESGQTLDVADRLILAPHSKDIRQYYWAADAFFFPTYYEPFGLVILEAMASGLPVVVSEAAGASELIEQGHSGLLIDPWDSSKNISNQLLPLLRDQNLCSSLAQAARMTAQHYSWELAGQMYRGFYSRLHKNRA